jgi:hypothetical protein
MPLTSSWLIAVALVATVAVAVGTVLVWRRPGRWWLPGRVVTLVLCEALVLASVGLMVNRHLDLYPSWSSLFGAVRPEREGRVRQPALSSFLAARAAQGERDGVVFAWHPPGEAGWHLPEAPLAYVPPAYFRQPADSFPVVLALAPPGGAVPARPGWDRLVRSGRAPAVVILVRIAYASPGALGTGLADGLEHDLRVTAHGWAVVGVGGADALALAMVNHSPGRYSTVAVVTDRTGPPSPTLVRAEQALPAGVSRLVEARLTAALAWVYPLLPAALGPPAMLKPIPPGELQRARPTPTTPYPSTGSRVFLSPQRRPRWPPTAAPR